MSLLSLIKGWFGETQSAVAHALFLDDKIYHSINNVTIPTANGTTQIDHVIVSRFGLFVVETKNMKGWIFGDEHSKNGRKACSGRSIDSRTPCTRTTDTPGPSRTSSASITTNCTRSSCSGVRPN